MFFEGTSSGTLAGCDGSGSASDGEKQDHWWIGAIIYIFGSITINLGNNLIRLSHEKNDKLPMEERRGIFRRPIWWAGITTFVCGNICNFVGFMFAAQALLSSLGSVQFLSNLFFATVVNKEKITRVAIIATGFIIGGNVIIVLFGPNRTQDYDLAGLWDLFQAERYVIYLSVLVSLIILLSIAYKVTEWRVRQLGPDAPSYLQRFLPFGYAAVSAMIGNNSVILGKATSGLVKLSLQKDQPNQFEDPFAYVVLFGFFCLIAFWVYRMNCALQQFPALFIIPVLQVIWLIFSITGGGIYFNEFGCLSGKDITLFVIGGLVLIMGVCILSMMVDSKPRVPEGSPIIVGGDIEDAKQPSEAIDIALKSPAHEPSLPNVATALFSAASYSSYRDLPYILQNSWENKPRRVRARSYEGQPAHASFSSFANITQPTNPPLASRENVQKRTQTWSSYYDLVQSNPNMALTIDSLGNRNASDEDDTSSK
eukprot:TRINITY_DN10694_c0_g1_i1.p1 TRINITY_DN10694_c0_g1~~TRINITY_DN10694_c0_g1_i1.p1  ORF type:complete len:482 (-),score=84.22 TRINITY_DN10694_c0_g1_i1:63-1508(-)